MAEVARAPCGTLKVKASFQSGHLVVFLMLVFFFFTLLSPLIKPTLTKGSRLSLLGIGNRFLALCTVIVKRPADGRYDRDMHTSCFSSGGLRSLQTSPHTSWVWLSSRFSRATRREPTTSLREKRSSSNTWNSIFNCWLLLTLDFFFSL